jgi:hypothetical protein
MLVSLTETVNLTDDDTSVERLLRSYALRPRVWNNRVMKPIGKIFDWVEALTTASEVFTKVAAFQYLKRQGAWSEIEIEHMVRVLAGTPPFMRAGEMAPVFNNLALFSNVWKEGQRRDWEAFTRDRTDYLLRRIVYSITPKLIMIAIAHGLLGDERREIMDGIGEYYKTNYICVPIRKTATGKSVAFCFPSDELGRLMGGITWKSYKAISDEPGGSIGALFDYMAGQAPTLNPIFGAAFNAVAIALGKNPIDWFRGKPIVKEAEFEAGGWRRWAGFVNHTWNSLGGTVFYKDLPRTLLPKTLSAKKAELRRAEQDAEAHWLEKALRMNAGFMAPVKRFIKITDQGHGDRLRGLTKEVRQEKTRNSQEVNEHIADFIHTHREDLPYRMPDQIIRVLHGKLALEGLNVGKLSTFEGRVRRLERLRVDNPYFQAWMYAQSDEERAVIYRDFMERRVGE